MSRARWILLTLALCMSIPSAANAAVGQGRYEHDGFFWRPLVFGYTYEGGFASDGDVSRQLHTGSLITVPVFTMGGTIGEDLILYGSLIAMHIATAGGTWAETGGEKTSPTLDRMMQIFLCLGLEQYFMPRNVFWGVEAGPVSLQLDSKDHVADESWGFKVKTHLGREWWVSENWGIGVGGEVSYSIIPDQWDGDPFVWHFVGAGLFGTLTYN